MLPVSWSYVVEAHSSHDAVLRVNKLLSRPTGRPTVTLDPAVVPTMANTSQFVAETAVKLDKQHGLN